MARIDELQNKYHKVNKMMAKKFFEADITPTKKFLEYYFKVWHNKEGMRNTFTSRELIETVQSFDKLNHLAQNKDIYNPFYFEFSNLKHVVDGIKMEYEDKSFDKEKNIRVLIENEKFLFLEPLTYEGSKKYGANTRWCTAARNAESTFNRYKSNGFLAYVVRKGETQISDNYKKFALYSDDTNTLNSEVLIYLSSDTTSGANQLETQGWEYENLFEIFTTFRLEANKKFRRKKATKDVDHILNTIKKIDLNYLQNCVNLLSNESIDDTVIGKAEKVLKDLIENISTNKKNFINVQ